MAVPTISSDDKRSMTLSDVILNYNSGIPSGGSRETQEKSGVTDFFKNMWNQWMNGNDETFTGPYKLRGSAAENYKAWESAYERYKGEVGITTPEGYAVLMGQVLHESANFQYMEELGNDGYFRRYEGRKDLGNVNPGDGPRFKGRGPIQVTGRANYTKVYEEFFKRVGRSDADIVNHPELGSDPYIGSMMSLGWILVTPGGNRLRQACNSAAGSSDMSGVILAATKAVNGGTNGLSDRGDKTMELLSQYRNTGSIKISV